MPLDPQAAAYLQAFAALGVPRLQDMTPAEARARVTPAPQPLQPVARIENQLIPGPYGSIPIRIYTPLEAAAGQNHGGLPLLVFFHGGGWVLGNLDIYDGLCRDLSHASGWKVMSVDYRLAPEHKYPVAVEEAYAAVLWSARNAVELSVDPARIAVCGDSAGGKLAAAVCLMARDRHAPEIAYQVLVYPVTDFSFDTNSYRENAEGFFLTRDAMIWCWEQYLADNAQGSQPYASPLRAGDFSDLPPAFVLTAEFDPLRDEGEAYAARLREAGVPVQLQFCEGMVHSFFRRTDVFDRARAMIAEIGRLLRNFTGPNIASAPPSL